MQNFGWIAFALAGALFAGVVNVLTKRGLDKVDFGVAMSIQSAALLATITAFVTVRGYWPKLMEMPPRSVTLLVCAGIAAGASWLCGYYALHLADVARTAPIDKLSLPIAVILAMIFLGESPTKSNWVGVVLMVAGAFFVTGAKK